MKTIKKSGFIFLLCIVIFFITTAESCSSTANTAEADKVDAQQTVYANNQPIPSYQWSLERHELIEIYNARNAAVNTYSLVYNQYKGIIVWQCPSYGYPIPGGTELTSPDAVTRSSSYGYAVTSQAEPNGTFSPPSSAGTYVMCRADDGTAYPVYEEDNVKTFPFMMKTDANGALVKATESEQPSIKINVKQPATSSQQPANSSTDQPVIKP